MSAIAILDLHPVGASLFTDDESYLEELSHQEMKIQGGITLLPAASLIVTAISVGIVIGSLAARYCDCR